MVAFVLEEPALVERVLALMDQHRLDGLLDSAAGSELWPDLLVLLNGFFVATEFALV